MRVDARSPHWYYGSEACPSDLSDKGSNYKVYGALLLSIHTDLLCDKLRVRNQQGFLCTQLRNPVVDRIVLAAEVSGNARSFREVGTLSHLRYEQTHPACASTEKSHGVDQQTDIP